MTGKVMEQQDAVWTAPLTPATDGHSRSRGFWRKLHHASLLASTAGLLTINAPGFAAVQAEPSADSQSDRIEAAQAEPSLPPGTCPQRIGSEFNPCDFDARRTMEYIKHPKDDLVLVSSHRGLHAFTNGKFRFIPENSKLAIRESAIRGVEQIELDIKLSKDGVPMISHDLTVGRMTDSGCNTKLGCFDPFRTGNPNDPNFDDAVNHRISELDSAALKRLKLRSNIDFSITDQNMLSLQDALEYMRDSGMQMVIALDIRDFQSTKAAYNVAKNIFDSKGRPYSKLILWKVPISQAIYTSGFGNRYPSFHPEALERAFPTDDLYHDIDQGLNKIKFQPVINSQDIDRLLQDPYFSEAEAYLIGEINRMGAFTYLKSLEIPSIEFTIKTTGANLQGAWNLARERYDGTRRSVSIFAPFEDLTSTMGVPVNGPRPYFFRTDGYCCATLPDFFFKNSPRYPDDFEDRRGDFNFILEQGANSVTRDPALGLMDELKRAGKRNISYLLPGSADDGDHGPEPEPCSQNCNGSVPPGTPVEPFKNDPVSPVAAPDTASTSPGFSNGMFPTKRRIRVLIDGDSMSAGAEGDYTWRYRIAQWFQREGIAVDFVGPRHDVNGPPVVTGPLPPSQKPPQGKLGGTYAKVDGKPVEFDSDHAAVWGKPMATAQSEIDDLVAQYDPDLVLVALGFNDVGWFYSDGQGTLNSLERYVANARSQNPGVKFVVANIPQRTTLGRQDLIDKTTYYNRNLPALLDRLQDPKRQSFLALADFNKEYACEPTQEQCASVYDGIHPSGKGEFRIAQAFANGLKDFFPNSRSSIPVPGGQVPRGLTVPQNVTFNGTLGGATATWDRVYGSTGYDVQWRKRKDRNSAWDAEWTKVTVGKERWDRTWPFTGAPDAGEQYEVKVAARYGSGSLVEQVSAFSATDRGIAAPTTPTEPRDLVVQPISRGFNVSWRAPASSAAGPVTEYALWIIDGDRVVTEEIISVFGTSKTLQGLTPGKNYTIVVEAWNKAGQGRPVILGNNKTRN